MTPESDQFEAIVRDIVLAHKDQILSIQDRTSMIVAWGASELELRTRDLRDSQIDEYLAIEAEIDAEVRRRLAIVQEEYQE